MSMVHVHIHICIACMHVQYIMLYYVSILIKPIGQKTSFGWKRWLQLQLRASRKHQDRKFPFHNQQSRFSFFTLLLFCWSFIVEQTNEYAAECMGMERYEKWDKLTVCLHGIQGCRKQIPSGKANKKSWLLAAGEGGAAKLLGLGDIWTMKNVLNLHLHTLIQCIQ